MSDKKIKITIDQIGNPKVEAIGFAGVGCTEATKGIEAALGGAQGGVTREMKTEFYQTEDEQQTQSMGW